MPDKYGTYSLSVDPTPMTEPRTADHNPIDISIGRQPVFDEKKRLWGYELFCVGSDEATRSGFPEEANVAINVQSGAYLCLQQIMDRGRKIIVDFSEKSILENLPYALPPVLAAVKVAEQACRQPSVVALLGKLKSEGYLIAVEGFSDYPACAPLCDLADILCIEVAGKGKEALGAILAKARKYKASWLASRIQDSVQFGICQELGFSLFHGAFFKAAEKVRIRKLSSNEVLRLNLLKFIEQDEPNLARLADTIQADATISFRLLAYLNSAAFALSQKIKSIHHAIGLLGWRNVKAWLRVVLLTDMNQTKEAHELVLVSAQRGLFLELVTREHDFWGFNPESLHLLGIFSLLDVLLGMPMAEIVANLPLDSKMKAALCREANNEYLPLLQLAQCLEEARWEDGESLIQKLNLDSKKVRTAFQASVNWSSEL
jgi:EAL and modified HD-GYP domain-containing signal transduction protein